MKIKVKFIIKIFSQANIDIINENGELPFGYLSESEPNIDTTIKEISEKYNLLESFFKDYKLVNFIIDNNEPVVYYTIVTPKDFTDEKIHNKFTSNFLSFSDKDGVCIRQALLMAPY